MSNNKPNEFLGVNKIGKNIRKSPLHQPNFVNNGSGSDNINNPARQQPQPQVYNISKNDFRSIVQQLTGSPSHQDPLLRPPNNPPKHPSMRLQRIKPPPLTPINRPVIPQVVAVPAPVQPPPQGPPMAPPVVPSDANNFTMPPPRFGQPSSRGMQPLVPGGLGWTNPALSPISAFMQQLQTCIGDEGPHSTLQPQVPGQAYPQTQIQPQIMGHNQAPPSMHPQFPGQAQSQPSSSGLLPNPSMQPLPSPRTNVPALLLSPSSNFLLPSPSGLFNYLSPTPLSPFPLLSPGSQFPTPLSPNFSFSPFGQPGILGPGPQPPLSPGIVFPLSPSGFFSTLSPRWRN